MNEYDLEYRQRIKESKKLYRQRIKLAKKAKRAARPTLPWKEMLLIALLTTKTRKKNNGF